MPAVECRLAFLAFDDNADISQVCTETPAQARPLPARPDFWAPHLERYAPFLALRSQLWSVLDAVCLGGGFGRALATALNVRCATLTVPPSCFSHAYGGV